MANIHLHTNIKHLLTQKKITFSVLKKRLRLKASSHNTIDSISDLVSLAHFFETDYNTLLADSSNHNKIQKNSIKFLILDVDGVLTDGGMYYTEKGDEFKKFNTKDGLAIKRLTAKGFKVGIASNGINKKIIANRAKLLGIKHVYVGIEKKELIIEKWLHKLKIKWSEVAYIGDDLNDLELFNRCGITACPANAVDAIKAKASVLLSRRGGDACVREFIDAYLK